MLPAGTPALVGAVLGYLTVINLMLGGFNLLPGAPLDGGRVFHALAWRWTGSRVQATRLATRSGSMFGLGIAFLGVVEIFAGALLGGVWLILIGFFLRAMAHAEYESAIMRRALAGTEVGEVAMGKVDVVAADTTLRELVDDHFLASGHRSYPVVDDGRVVGVIAARDVLSVPKGQWSSEPVRAHARALGPENRVAPDEPLSEAMQRLGRAEHGLLVMRGDELVGMLTRESLARFVEVRRQFGDERAGGDA